MYKKANPLQKDVLLLLYGAKMGDILPAILPVIIEQYELNEFGIVLSDEVRRGCERALKNSIRKIAARLNRLTSLVASIDGNQIVLNSKTVGRFRDGAIWDLDITELDTEIIPIIEKQRYTSTKTKEVIDKLKTGIEQPKPYQQIVDTEHEIIVKNPLKFGLEARRRFTLLLKELGAKSGIKAPVSLEKEKEVNVLLIGDIHYGKRIKTVNEIYFNKETILKRLNLFLQKIESHIRNKPTAIFFLGDMIDNDIIYPTQRFNVEMPVMEQVFDVTEVIWRVLELVQGISGHFLNVYGVPGNHGRVSDISSMYSNWDTVLYHALSTIAKCTAADINITVNDPVLSTNIGGVMFMAKHDGIARCGIPSASKKITSWKNMFKDDKDTTQTCLLQGHKHQFFCGDQEGTLVVSNGTILTQDSLAVKLGLYSEPEQTLLKVSNGYVTDIIPVWLND